MNITRKTYEVFFRVYLYPAGINIFNYEEECDANEHIYSYNIQHVKEFNFNKYLCTEFQSRFVLDYLKVEYLLPYIDDVSIYELQYYNNGIFNCKIGIVYIEELNEDHIQEIIRDSIWTGTYKEPIYICIDGVILKMDIVLDYYVEGGGDADTDTDTVVSFTYETSDDENSSQQIHPYYISSDESDESDEHNYTDQKKI